MKDWTAQFETPGGKRTLAFPADAKLPEAIKTAKANAGPGWKLIEGSVKRANATPDEPTETPDVPVTDAKEPTK